KICHLALADAGTKRFSRVTQRFGCRFRPMIDADGVVMVGLYAPGGASDQSCLKNCLRDTSRSPVATEVGSQPPGLTAWLWRIPSYAEPRRASADALEAKNAQGCPRARGRNL